MRLLIHFPDGSTFSVDKLTVVMLFISAFVGNNNPDQDVINRYMNSLSVNPVYARHVICSLGWDVLYPHLTLEDSSYGYYKNALELFAIVRNQE